MAKEQKHIEAEQSVVPVAANFTNRQIHIDKLERSSSNVRHAQKGNDEQSQEGAPLEVGMPRAVLRATLLAVGLMSPLVVEAVAGKPGVFGVVAGGRRLRELKALHADGLLSSPLIDCREVPPGADLSLISLVENVARQDMHPADECAAYLELFRKGHTVAQIAAHFATGAKQVQQRLALANLHPEVLASFRARKLGMDAAQAFAYEPDQARQLQVFKLIGGNKGARVDEWRVRQSLKDEDVELDHRFVKLVGVDAYRDAGGSFATDLFSEGRAEQRLSDPLLLEGLASAIMEETAEAQRAEGWAWVEVLTNDNIYGIAHDRKLQQVGRKDAKKEEAGFFVTCSWEGKVKIEGPYVSRAVAQARERAKHRAEVKGTEGADAPQDEAKVPDSLMHSLTAHKSAALQCALLGNQRVTLALLAATLVSRYSYRGTGLHAKIDNKGRDLAELARGYSGTRAAQELETADAVWEGRIPEDTDALAWFLDQPEAVSIEAIVWSCARGYSFANVRNGTDENVERLAAALGFNVADYFVATADTYLSQVPKVKIVQAVTEACGKDAAAPLESMKKGELVTAAQAKLAGTRWVPYAIR